MKILITNDDGIDANGIIRLAECAKNFGEVWVVAPDSQRSAMSHSITLRHGFKAWEVPFPVEGVHAFACDGTPADCARIGVLNIVPGKPDVVLSGINYGWNVASDLQYSATAGAAFEARFQGIKAIALSEPFLENPEPTNDNLYAILEETLKMDCPENQIINVNFPECTSAECKGILRDRKVSRGCVFKDHYSETPAENGAIEYMVVGELQNCGEPGTDLDAVFNNYISIGYASNIG